MIESSTQSRKSALPPSVWWAIVSGFLVSVVASLVAGVEANSVWVGISTFPIVATLIGALVIIACLALDREGKTTAWLSEHQTEIALALFVSLCVGVLGMGISFVSGKMDFIYPNILDVARQNEIPSSRQPGKSQQEATRGECTIKVATETVLSLDCVEQSNRSYPTVALEGIVTLPMTHELGREVGRVILGVAQRDDPAHEDTAKAKGNARAKTKDGSKPSRSITCQQIEGGHAQEKQSDASYTCYLNSNQDPGHGVDPTSDLRVILLEAGLAVVGPDIKDESELRKAETRAKDARRGLWWDPPENGVDPIAWRIARDETRPNADLTSAQRAAAFGQFIVAICTALIGFGFVFGKIEQTYRQRVRRLGIEQLLCKAGREAKGRLQELQVLCDTYQDDCSDAYWRRLEERWRVVTQNLPSAYETRIANAKENLETGGELSEETIRQIEALIDNTTGFLKRIAKDLLKNSPLSLVGDERREFISETKIVFDAYGSQIEKLGTI